jgi:hypothetical protein
MKYGKKDVKTMESEKKKNTVHFFFAELLRRAPASDGEKLGKKLSQLLGREDSRNHL